MNLNELALRKDTDHYSKTQNRNLPLKGAGGKKPSHFNSSQISPNVFHALPTTFWTVQARQLLLSAQGHSSPRTVATTAAHKTLARLFC